MPSNSRPSQPPQLTRRCHWRKKTKISEPGDSSRDLFGMVRLGDLLERLSDLQLGDEKGTLNQLEHVHFKNLLQRFEYSLVTLVLQSTLLFECMQAFRLQKIPPEKVLGALGTIQPSSAFRKTKRSMFCRLLLFFFIDPRPANLPG